MSQGFRDGYREHAQRAKLERVSLHDMFIIYRDGNDAGLVNFKERDAIGRRIRAALGLDPALPSDPDDYEIEAEVIDE